MSYSIFHAGFQTVLRFVAGWSPRDWMIFWSVLATASSDLNLSFPPQLPVTLETGDHLKLPNHQRRSNYKDNLYDCSDINFEVSWNILIVLVVFCNILIRIRLLSKTKLKCIEKKNFNWGINNFCKEFK